MACAAGGSVDGQPVDQPWGLRQAVVVDPEGQRWEVVSTAMVSAPDA